MQTTDLREVTLSYNTDLVRELLRKFYVLVPSDTRVLTESFVLSDPHVDGLGRDDVRLHVDRLLSLGWVYPTHNIVMKNHVEQPVTYRPTSEAFRWARFAWEDELWREQVEALRVVLDADEPASTSSERRFGGDSD